MFIAHMVFLGIQNRTLGNVLGYDYYIYSMYLFSLSLAFVCLHVYMENPLFTPMYLY